MYSTYLSLLHMLNIVSRNEMKICGEGKTEPGIQSWKKLKSLSNDS